MLYLRIITVLISMVVIISHFPEICHAKSIYNKNIKVVSGGQLKKEYSKDMMNVIKNYTNKDFVYIGRVSKITYVQNSKLYYGHKLCISFKGGFNAYYNIFFGPSVTSVRTDDVITSICSGLHIGKNNSFSAKCTPVLHTRKTGKKSEKILWVNKNGNILKKVFAEKYRKRIMTDFARKK